MIEPRLKNCSSISIDSTPLSIFAYARSTFGKRSYLIVLRLYYESAKTINKSPLTINLNAGEPVSEARRVSAFKDCRNGKGSVTFYVPPVALRIYRGESFAELFTRGELRVNNPLSG